MKIMIVNVKTGKKAKLAERVPKFVASQIIEALSSWDFAGENEIIFIAPDDLSFWPVFLIVGFYAGVILKGLLG